MQNQLLKSATIKKHQFINFNCWRKY